MMIGKKPGGFWWLTWKYITPGAIFVRQFSSKKNKKTSSEIATNNLKLRSLFSFKGCFHFESYSADSVDVRGLRVPAVGEHVGLVDRGFPLCCPCVCVLLHLLHDGRLYGL